MEMRAIGRGSISSVLKVLVDIAWIGACAALGFIWVVTILGALAMSGVVHIAVFEHIQLQAPGELARLALNGSILCIGAMIVCAYLRGVFETLVNGDPFVPENARRLRAIALVLALIEVVRLFLDLIVQLVLALFGVSGSGAETRHIEIQISLPVWFSVLTLVVLAQVFREGAALREEQKMTI